MPYAAECISTSFDAVVARRSSQERHRKLGQPKEGPQSRRARAQYLRRDSMAKATRAPISVAGRSWPTMARGRNLW